MVRHSLLILIFIKAVIAASTRGKVDTSLNFRQVFEFSSIGSRIVGGEEALDEQLPYQAGLLLFSTNGSAWCGGSLIERRWVVTAAHCLQDRISGTVYLGTHKILGTNELGTQIIHVTSEMFIKHPNYDEFLISNDIGLIHLPVDARISRDIKIIALPSGLYANEDFEGAIAVASGWGHFSDNIQIISGVLRFVHLEVVPNSVCSSLYGTHRVRDSNICTSGRDLKSPCKGDSGGPLAYKVGKKMHLIGIISFGSSSGCEKKYPGVFVRVTYYLDWIQNVMKQYSGKM